MNDNIRFDAHCHIFTLKYILKEVKSLLHDIINRTYPWEAPSKQSLQLTSENRIAEIKDFLRQLYELLHSAFSSEEENLIFLQKEEKKEFPDDNLRIIPLMMDVFYMLAYSLDKDQDVTPMVGLKSGLVDEKEFQDSWDDVISDFKVYLNNQKALVSSKKGYVAERKIKLALEAIEEESSVREMFLSKKIRDIRGSNLNGFYRTDGFCYHMDELMALVKNRKDELYPFVAIDPRRPGIIKTLLNGDFFKGEQRFYGVKLYPRMGYHPQCKPMDDVYKYCSDNSIPITYHCGMSGFPPGTKWKHTEFGNPINFEPIVKKYPNLRIDFAHMGSSSDLVWSRTVDRLVRENENVYTDFSCYTSLKDLNPMREFWDSNPKLKTRLMFGTDFDVMYLTDRVTMKEYYENFKHFFADDELFSIMHDNPIRFLGL
ncbi:MAG TPA: hypothetical protein DIW31_03460 [Bacteroidales bacterium]|nr:hypothetical protein [Bacteroidales bacterium]